MRWRASSLFLVLSTLAASPLIAQTGSPGITRDNNSSMLSTSAVPSDAAAADAVPADLALTDAAPANAAPRDINQSIYYRNKTELSTEVGYLPFNVPLIFDFLVGSAYTTWPLKYTLVPTITSLRWHVSGINGRSVLRGSWDFTFSFAATAIPSGPETHYFAFDYGIRRNFIPRNWRVVPYYEMRGGVGYINAKGPDGVLYAQGQDLTFTLMVGSGVRWNLNPKYSLEFGATYMHVSNAYLSQPKYQDYGINVWGPLVGFNMRLGKPKKP
jgi:hypothetical protein